MQNFSENDAKELRKIAKLAPIDNFQNLDYLDISDSGLTYIPTSVFKLSRIQYLLLYKNELTTLPPEIGNLTNLCSLSLSDNQLTSLPHEIGNLTNLNNLYIHNNQLTTLPHEIGNLTKLKKLFLDNNLFISLPPELGNLTKLNQLTINNNQLTSPPPEIGDLTNSNNLVVSKTKPILSRHQTDTLKIYPMTVIGDFKKTITASNPMHKYMKSYVTVRNLSNDPSKCITASSSNATTPFIFPSQSPETLIKEIYKRPDISEDFGDPLLVNTAEFEANLQLLMNEGMTAASRVEFPFSMKLDNGKKVKVSKYQFQPNSIYPFQGTSYFVPTKPAFVVVTTEIIEDPSNPSITPNHPVQDSNFYLLVVWHERPVTPTPGFFTKSVGIAQNGFGKYLILLDVTEIKEDAPQPNRNHVALLPPITMHQVFERRKTDKTAPTFTVTQLVDIATRLGVQLDILNEALYFRSTLHSIIITSPEFIGGDKTLNFRLDLFSLGLTTELPSNVERHVITRKSYLQLIILMATGCLRMSDPSLPQKLYEAHAWNPGFVVVALDLYNSLLKHSTFTSSSKLKEISKSMETFNEIRKKDSMNFNYTPAHTFGLLSGMACVHSKTLHSMSTHALHELLYRTMATNRREFLDVVAYVCNSIKVVVPSQRQTVLQDPTSSTASSNWMKRMDIIQICLLEAERSGNMEILKNLQQQLLEANICSQLGASLAGSGVKVSLKILLPVVRISCLMALGFPTLATRFMYDRNARKMCHMLKEALEKNYITPEEREMYTVMLLVSSDFGAWKGQDDTMLLTIFNDANPSLFVRYAPMCLFPTHSSATVIHVVRKLESCFIQLLRTHLDIAGPIVPLVTSNSGKNTIGSPHGRIPLGGTNGDMIPDPISKSIDSSSQQSKSSSIATAPSPLTKKDILEDALFALQCLVSISWNGPDQAAIASFKNLYSSHFSAMIFSKPSHSLFVTVPQDRPNSLPVPSLSAQFFDFVLAPLNPSPTTNISSSLMNSIEAGNNQMKDPEQDKSSYDDAETVHRTNTICTLTDPKVHLLIINPAKLINDKESPNFGAGQSSFSNLTPTSSLASTATTQSSSSSSLLSLSSSFNSDHPNLNDDSNSPEQIMSLSRKLGLELQSFRNHAKQRPYNGPMESRNTLDEYLTSQTEYDHSNTKIVPCKSSFSNSHQSVNAVDETPFFDTSQGYSLKQLHSFQNPQFSNQLFSQLEYTLAPPSISQLDIQQFSPYSVQLLDNLIKWAKNWDFMNPHGIELLRFSPKMPLKPPVLARFHRPHMDNTSKFYIPSPSGCPDHWDACYLQMPGNEFAQLLVMPHQTAVVRNNTLLGYNNPNNNMTTAGDHVGNLTPFSSARNDALAALPWPLPANQDAPPMIKTILTKDLKELPIPIEVTQFPAVTLTSVIPLCSVDLTKKSSSLNPEGTAGLYEIRLVDAGEFNDVWIGLTFDQVADDVPFSLKRTSTFPGRDSDTSFGLELSTGTLHYWSLEGTKKAIPYTNRCGSGSKIWIGVTLVGSFFIAVDNTFYPPFNPKLPSSKLEPRVMVRFGCPGIKLSTRCMIQNWTYDLTDPNQQASSSAENPLAYSLYLCQQRNLMCSHAHARKILYERAQLKEFKSGSLAYESLTQEMKDLMELIHLSNDECGGTECHAPAALQKVVTRFLSQSTRSSAAQGESLITSKPLHSAPSIETTGPSISLINLPSATSYISTKR